MRAWSAKLVLSNTGNVLTGHRFEFARQPRLQDFGFADVFVDEVGPRTGILPRAVVQHPRLCLAQSHSARRRACTPGRQSPPAKEVPA